MKDVELGSCGSWLLQVGRSTYAIGGKSPTGLGHGPNSHVTAQKHVPAGTRGARHDRVTTSALRLEILVELRDHNFSRTEDPRMEHQLI